MASRRSSKAGVSKGRRSAAAIEAGAYQHAQDASRLLAKLLGAMERG
jgi:hypothetical protein